MKKIIKEDDMMVNMAKDLLVAMENQKITKRDLVTRWKKTRYFVNRTLKGTNTNLTLEDLFDLAHILGIKITFSLEDNDELDESV